VNAASSSPAGAWKGPIDPLEPTAESTVTIPMPPIASRSAIGPYSLGARNR